MLTLVGASPRTSSCFGALSWSCTTIQRHCIDPARRDAVPAKHRHSHAHLTSLTSAALTTIELYHNQMLLCYCAIVCFTLHHHFSHFSHSYNFFHNQLSHPSHPSQPSHRSHPAHHHIPKTNIPDMAPPSPPAAPPAQGETEMFGALRRTKPRARRESRSPSPSSSPSSSGDQIAMTEADAALWEADPQGYMEAQLAVLRAGAEEAEAKKKKVSWANLADGGYLAGEVDGVAVRDFAVFPEQRQQQQSEQEEIEETVEDDEEGDGDEEEESSSDEVGGLTMAVRKRTA